MFHEYSPNLYPSGMHSLSRADFSYQIAGSTFMGRSCDPHHPSSVLYRVPILSLAATCTSAAGTARASVKRQASCRASTFFGPPHLKGKDLIAQFIHVLR